MTSLMSAYSTDVPVSRAALRDVPVPPATGRFHMPISFADYVDVVADNLDRAGYQIGREEHIVGHEGMRHFGLLEVAPKALEGEYIGKDEYSFFVGLRGSHDQSVPRSLAVGRSVMVCSNLCFSGDLGSLNTKQTTNIWSRLPSMVHEAVARLPERIEQEEGRIELLKDFDLKPRWGDAALVEIMRRGGMTPAHLGRAIKEWDRPTYEEHAENGFTAWRLEQAVTEAVKPTGQTSNLFTTQNRTVRASEFIDEMTGWAA